MRKDYFFIMSNKDINCPIGNQNDINKDITTKSNLHLFSFSQLKSKKNFKLSQLNNFNFNFSTKNITEKDEKENSNEKKNRKVTLIEGDNTSSLKTLNIDVPSSEKLNEKDFQEKFMNDFEDSFANFCGINKKQFKDIYINNKYIPILNEFGDLNISINNIIEILESYSSSLKLKITRRILKKYKINKIFKTFKNKNGNKKKKSGRKKKFNRKVKNIEIEESKNDIIKTSDKGNQTNNAQENNILDNFKKKLKKIIINKDNNDRKSNNNHRNNNEKGIFIRPISKQNNFFNPKNDIFNFSPNTIQNTFSLQNKNINEFLNNKRANTQRFNNINNINNFNTNNQIISPQILSPYGDIKSANSYCLSNGNLVSPNIFTFSPFFNNNYYNIDRFTYNNYNSNFNSFKFLNTPFIINNNINPNNNIIYLNKNEKGGKITEIDNKI